MGEHSPGPREPSTFAAVLAAVVAIVLALCGLWLGVGGAWLLSLGGSWYYLLAGLAMLMVAVLLWRRQASALWLFAVLFAATLAWSLWESGLDWWPLAARLGLLFLFGAALLLPPLHRRFAGAGRAGGRGVLALVMLAFVGVAVASWFHDPHDVDGTLAMEAPAPAQAERGIPPGEWHAYGGTWAGQRYSPLTQVTPDNVRQLELAWHYETGDVRGDEGDPKETTYQVTPLKVGQRLFLCTPHQRVIALDATTGRELWRFDPQVQDRLALQHLTCRGLSYLAPDAPRAQLSSANPPAPPAGAPANEVGAPHPIRAASQGATVERCPAKLYMPTADGRVIALDPDTGRVCTDFGDGSGQINLWAGMPNYRPGAYYSTSPPVVAGGLLVIGGTVLDNVSVNEQSGVIRAYDADSGALVWNWDAGNPEQTQPLAPGERYVVNSPNSWTIMAADAELGLVYVPTGNQPPDQWGGRRSPAVERYSSSIVALDLATGRVRWHFQTVHHDLWDYDVPSQPSLLDLRVGGQVVPALVQPTKQGELFVLDRRSGQPLLPVREVAAPQGAARGDSTAPTQPKSALSFEPPPLSGARMWGATLLDQLACRIAFHRLRYDGRFTPPSVEGSLVYPGNFGVFNWGSIAVDPAHGIAFTTPAYLAFISRLVPRPDDTTPVVQGDEPPSGSLPALNENFGAPFAAELKPFLSPGLGLPCQQPPWGFVAGVELSSGRIAWMHRNGTVRDLAPLPLPFKMGVPDLGGPLVTAGGVAFNSGTLDYYVRGYELRTGRELWRARLPAGGQATPMTYLGADGRQYLLVVAGGHGSLGTKAGDDILAYALPAR